MHKILKIKPHLSVQPEHLRKFNINNPNKKQFTKKQHSSLQGLNSIDIVMWNQDGHNNDKYTKEEYLHAEKFHLVKPFTWNKNKENEMFTIEETKIIQDIQKKPLEINTKIFYKYIKFICVVYKYQFKTHSEFIKIMKSRNI